MQPLVGGGDLQAMISFQPLKNNRGFSRAVCWAICLLFLLCGCGNRDRLVVYSDPWLQAYALDITAEFQRLHPDVDVELKVLSSEVVAQHLHFGQPIDVFLCFGSELYSSQGLASHVQEQHPLASTRVMHVAQRGTQFAGKQQAFGTIGCVAWEASERPMRQYAEQAFGATDTVACRLVANFQAQMVDYLRRGWVPAGFVPGHFALSDSSQFGIVRSGPVIHNAFSALMIKDGPNPDNAEAFFALIKSEKTKELLGRLRFLP